MVQYAKGERERERERERSLMSQCPSEKPKRHPRNSLWPQ